MKKEDGPQLGTGLVGRRRRASNVHNHSDETVQLDDELVCILMEIERIYVDFPKPLQIRIEKWVEKISEPILHLQWKKNANNYAILLLHMARRGVFRAPFDKAPPLGPLQTLPRHMICSLDGLQKPPRKPPPHPRNAWLKAYERVVHRTRPTSTESSDFAAVTTPPAPVPQGRDPRRPLSYVEIVNETINNLEAELAAERSTNVSLHEQLEVRFSASHELATHLNNNSTWTGAHASVQIASCVNSGVESRAPRSERPSQSRNRAPAHVACHGTRRPQEEASTTDA
ncbi:hypothetical protein, variant 1 [Aphanomyces invadans]|uniref:DUF4485 domain-containing protein n=1 Tax=Aphanomyces invadans TaxID=157072 RepID=A0A024TLH6_9STRA|nr:hypothetical protein, variant 1 [Aphanomyces invadans]ETV94461.1 hypothetical protein, variant 1 [Aphanomyces invadans]|eukprot:XP_008876777.1 hypothetical protein, variant 1 [Aphanomyces invadans]